MLWRASLPGVVFGLIYGLFVVARVAIAGADSEETKPPSQSTERAIVPRSLSEWHSTVAMGDRIRFTRALVEIASNNAVTVRTPAQKEMKFELEPHLKEAYFEQLAATINRYYLISGENSAFGLESRGDPYYLRLSHGSRAVTLGFDPEDPERMGLEPSFQVVVDIANRQLRRAASGRTFPEPLRSSTHPPEPSKEPERDIVPANLKYWSTRIQLKSSKHTSQLILYPKGTQYELILGQDEKRHRLPIQNNQQRQQFLECARTIVNQFSLLPAEDEPLSPGDPIEVSVNISAGSRGIGVEFNSTARIPTLWRDKLSEIIQMTNDLLEPDQEKISPIDAN